MLDYESRFRDAVIEDFADTYLAGETPIPCIRCNQTVKFRDLLETARDLGADCMATGHYVRRVDGPAGRSCTAPPIRPATRATSCSPPRASSSTSCASRWAACAKAETRGAGGARSASPVADKPDSQDICFVPDGNYADVIEKLRPGAAEPGEIVHLDGRVLGRHEGVIRYTDRPAPRPRRRRRRAAVRRAARRRTRRVIVGPREALATRSVPVAEVNWLGDAPFEEAPPEGWEVAVRVRSTRRPKPARVRPRGPDRAEVELLAPEEGVAPGQACVFYAAEGTRVLGGGWIVCG